MKYKIEHDAYYPLNPREDYDHLGTMVCWHSRYNLGDEQPRETIGEWLSGMLWDNNIERVDKEGYLTQHWEDFIYDLENDDPESIQKAWGLLDDKLIVLPLYLYDHSGITINTTGFSCPWDSGQVGFIYITLDKVREEYEWERITKKRRERIERYLRAEVKEYDQYLTGDVWGFTILDDDGEIIDSCSGFFGYDNCEQEARQELEFLIDWDKANPEILVDAMTGDCTLM